ncbi:uncharacterized protein BDZ99DRAFT_527148 [Mytilinidion resinicola]|uniref:Uncharacterized protein n=1 Tax=Mytilinidion resinicola TaxID=574789 RepID=A0A6A6Y2C7_9PEZI|nr:uncharacterized protein BDZ99DRAFT_527148 [Mytilinidion resinicola]KAF2802708.1 hypothetical protein BDZ99DRAFT_527148 [Mytilinidion resinicola]
MSTASHGHQTIESDANGGVNNETDGEATIGRGHDEDGDGYDDDEDHTGTESLAGYRPGPYYHGLCMKKFKSPSAVRHHHYGTGNLSGGCWVKYGRLPRRFWNDHESCWKDGKREYSNNSDPNARYEFEDFPNLPKFTMADFNVLDQIKKFGEEEDALLDPATKSLDWFNYKYARNGGPLNNFFELVTDTFMTQLAQDNDDTQKLSQELSQMLRARITDPLVLARMAAATGLEETVVVVMQTWEGLIRSLRDKGDIPAVLMEMTRLSMFVGRFRGMEGKIKADALINEHWQSLTNLDGTKESEAEDEDGTATVAQPRSTTEAEPSRPPKRRPGAAQAAVPPPKKRTQPTRTSAAKTLPARNEPVTRSQKANGTYGARN